MGDSSEIYDDIFLKAILPLQTFERLIQSRVMNEIATKKKSGFKFCFFCNQQFPSAEGKKLICNKCHKETCFDCGKEYHDGQNCQEINDDTTDPLIRSIVRECPICKTSFLKEEGCNKMECPRCHTFICYTCRKVIPPEVGYSHFYQGNGPCPVGSCPLFVDNKLLHTIETIEAEEFH